MVETIKRAYVNEKKGSSLSLLLSKLKMRRKWWMARAIRSTTVHCKTKMETLCSSSLNAGNFIGQLLQMFL